MIKQWYESDSTRKPLKLVPRSRRIAPLIPQKKYDAIVVGAGPAGSTAACFMAREGLDVLLIERGAYPGAKNCGGSALIAEHTHKLFPNFWDELEYERIVTDQAYWFMTDDSITAVRYCSLKLAAAPYNRFTVRRTKLYRWLTDKAVTAGATFKLSCHASEILFEGDQAVGVKIAVPHEECYLADIIILADGANSMLAEKGGLSPRVSAQNMALYVMETISLPSDVIEERFNLLPGHGSIIGLIGYPTAGFNGTGSIHLFKDAVSLNVGLMTEDIAKAGIRPYELLERIKKHPLMQPLLESGVTSGYGSVMIPEGGYHAIPQLVHPGLMLVGDAASLVNGVHGYNLAMWSGYFAAQAAVAARKKRDYSERSLSLYKTLLAESFVMQDLKANAGAAGLQRDIPYMFDLYTRMANEAAYHAIKVYTMPKRAKRMFIFKKVTSMQPVLKVLRDAWKTLKVIR